MPIGWRGDCRKVVDTSPSFSNLSAGHHAFNVPNGLDEVGSGPDASFYEQGIVNLGESFLRRDDKWNDFASADTAVAVFGLNNMIAGLVYDNFPIKAFSEPWQHEHQWTEPAYTWSDDKSTCTATRLCQTSGCGEEESETVEVVAEVTLEPTATKPGKRVYTATFESGAFATQVLEEEIPAKGLDDYRVEQGDGATWAKGENATLEFQVASDKGADEAYGHFARVLVDGKPVDERDFFVKRGVKVLLLPAFLESLDEGHHIAVIEFDNGGVEANFTIAGQDANKDLLASAGVDEHAGKDKAADQQAAGQQGGVSQQDSAQQKASKPEAAKPATTKTADLKAQPAAKAESASQGAKPLPLPSPASVEKAASDLKGAVKGALPKTSDPNNMAAVAVCAGLSALTFVSAGFLRRSRRPNG